MRIEHQPIRDDLSTDFVSFVADRTGCSLEHALQSIGQWLLEYEPVVTLTNCRQCYSEEQPGCDTSSSDTIVQSR